MSLFINIEQVNDPMTFPKTTSSEGSDKLIIKLEKELKTMQHNEIWELKDLP